jgi:ABC-type nitrate/sulfonate/bicarbonate transport system substrate-binding protein
MQALARRELDIASGGIGLMLFQLIADGAPISVIGDRALLLPGYGAHDWLLRKDFVGTIKSVADLKGRPVAINFPGSPRVASIADQLRWYRERGLLAKPLGMDEIVESSLIAEAERQLQREHGR